MIFNNKKLIINLLKRNNQSLTVLVYNSTSYFCFYYVSFIYKIYYIVKLG